MHTVIHEKLCDISASQWNAMIPQGYPFLHYEFLYGLEKSRCTSSHNGWLGQHVVIYEDNSCQNILGALPCYLKHHSYGEYIFDWAWADAYQRAGLEYYPKLSCAIPFTPVTGPRWLIAQTVDPEPIQNQLLDALLHHAQQLGVSSIHCLFTTAEMNTALRQKQFIQRHSSQFHWLNKNYTDFTDFTAGLSSKKRKNINRERRRVQEAHIEYQWYNAEQLDNDVMQTMFGFYQSTIARYGAQQYLNNEFFQHLQQHLATQTHVLLAYHEQQAIAGGIYFSSDNALYGRYWGASDDYHSLHFETCYYQAIDYCIQRGINRFEAGAQGEHKLSRGLLPNTTYSMHWLSDARFHDAVEQYVDEESLQIKRYNQLLNQHSPYREIE